VSARASVRRVLEIKRRLGLLERRTVPIDSIPLVVGSRRFQDAANDLRYARSHWCATWRTTARFAGASRRLALIAYADEQNSSVGALLTDLLRRRRTRWTSRLWPMSGTLSYDSARAVIAGRRPRCSSQRAAHLVEGKHRPSGLPRPAHHSDGRGPPPRAWCRRQPLPPQPDAHSAVLPHRVSACGPRSAPWRSRCWAACRSAATSRLASRRTTPRLGSGALPPYGHEARHHAHGSRTHHPRVAERHQEATRPRDRGHPLAAPSSSASTARASQASSLPPGRVDSGAFPGAVLAGDGTAARAARASGPLGVDDPRPVEAGTLYDLASLTKVVGLTTPACCWSIRASSTSMHPSPYVPEFRGAMKGTRHGSTPVDALGGPRCRSPVVRLHGDPCAALAAVDTTTLVAPPGSSYTYSDLSAIVLMQG